MTQHQQSHCIRGAISYWAGSTVISTGHYLKSNLSNGIWTYG